MYGNKNIFLHLNHPMRTYDLYLYTFFYIKKDVGNDLNKSRIFRCEILLFSYYQLITITSQIAPSFMRTKKFLFETCAFVYILHVIMVRLYHYIFDNLHKFSNLEK